MLCSTDNDERVDVAGIFRSMQIALAGISTDQATNPDFEICMNQLLMTEHDDEVHLKNIDGLNLYTAIKKSSEIIAPEGIVTHIGYRLNKKILSLMYFKLKNR